MEAGEATYCGVSTGREPKTASRFPNPTPAFPEGEGDLFMDYSYRCTHVSARFGRTHGSAPTGKMAESQCSASIPTPELVLDHGFRWDGDEAHGGGGGVSNVP